MDDLPLAAEFPAATRERWLALVEGVLKGADFEKRLVSRTYDGVRIEPLYPKAENAQPVVRADRAPWRVSQRVDHPEPEAASQLALADLEGGADALTLVLAGAPAARGFGLRIGTIEDLDRALAGTMLDLVHLRLDAGGGARQTAALLAEEAGLTTPLRYDERIYEATPQRLVEVVSQTEESAGELLLVGHNPGLEELLELLTGEARRMPTAALACVQLDADKWSKIAPRSGRLEWHVKPKELGAGG